MKAEQIIEELGLNTQERPQGKPDSLTLICEMACTIARNITEDWLPNDLMHKAPEIELLIQARRLLVLNARHAPLIIDQAIDLAEEHRPKEP